MLFAFEMDLECLFCKTDWLIVGLMWSMSSPIEMNYIQEDFDSRLHCEICAKDK